MNKNISNNNDILTSFSNPSSNNYAVNVNLIEDINTIARKCLKKENITLKHKNEPYLDYLVSRLQIVEAKPRAIKHCNSFVCPQGYEDKLTFIEDFIKKGKSLRPFFTKRVTNLNKCDYLLYDWGVYHLHLSNKIQKKGMAERSSKLILSVITSDTVYMLAVVSHNQSLLWEDKKILDMIKRNIPNITKHLILNNVTNLACDFKEHDIKKLRKCGINTINHVGNDFSLGPGLGYATDGTPLKAVIKKNQDYHILREMGEYLEKMLIAKVNAS